MLNVAEEQIDLAPYRQHVPPETPLIAIPLDLERELMQMEESERPAYYQELGVEPSDRDALIRTLMETSGQILFFTTGEKEVRTWLIRRGGTAVEAAGAIHTDLARGFIRAETIRADDLIRLGSEREIKAHNLMRAEPKDYVIQEGDILLVRHN